MLKRVKLFLLIVIGIQMTVVPFPASAQSGVVDGDEPYSGAAVCLPGVYMQQPDHCLALGPSAFLTEQARKGMPYPLRALPAVKPDPALVPPPAYYARIGLEANQPAPVYPSFDAAVSGTSPSRYIEAGPIRYVAYIDQRDVNDAHYLMLPSGEWIRASPAGYSHFQGILLRQTPRNGFGWILTESPVYSTPGFGAPQTGRVVNRENIVQIYASEEAENVNWVMIGRDEWIEDRVVGRVTPNPVPPEGVTNNRWIEVNLDEQTLAVYDQKQLVFATLITTGVEPFYTQPGLFQIYQKKQLETMQGSFEVDRSDYYYLQNVPWTMYFDQARALHGAYWRTTYGYPGSHGCVNLSPGDSHWLFDWAQEGDWVYVWDPSGRTPTDPAYYSAGGA